MTLPMSKASCASVTAIFPRLVSCCCRSTIAAAARGWLRDLQVTSAEDLPEPAKNALQIAFSATGLKALALPQEILAKFSSEFLSGMAGEESRSRRLGDLGADAPNLWRWGGPEKVPHVLLMLYAEKGALDSLA